jgi:tetratricopeptide (TPR) repeat protein
MSSNSLERSLADQLLQAGHAQRRAGRVAEAPASYARAIALQPGSAEARFHRADLVLALGRSAEALAGFEAAIALEPRAVAAHANRGAALQDAAVRHG